MSTQSSLKLFTEMSQTKLYNAALLQSSNGNKNVADMRMKAYTELFKNLEHFNKTKAKMYSTNYAATESLSNQFFKATVGSLVKSFAGFLSIEKSMDQPEALLGYLDLFDSQGRNVLPNIGQENIGAIGLYDNAISSVVPFVNAQYTYTVLTTKKLIPGSVKLEVTIGSTVTTITDDKSGNLVTIAGVLDAGTVNYTTGAISVEFNSGFSFTPVTDKIKVTAVQSQSDTANLSKFTAKMGYYNLKAFPEILIGEMDIVAMMSLEKSTGLSVSEFIGNKLQELYIKLLNHKLVNAVATAGNIGDTFEIDASGLNYQDYKAYRDHLAGELNGVDQALGSKSIKGMNATCYVASPNMVTEFKKLTQIGSFVEAPRSYVNDLAGYLEGRPVLQHDSLSGYDFYAVHKTSDGQLAPAIQGYYLPLTDTPLVSDYNQPLQQSKGVFYQQGTGILEPVLVQKVTYTPA